MENEAWKPVVGFELTYEVSDQGRVRSLDRLVWRPTTPFRRKGAIIKPQLDGDGYPKVALGRAHQRRVHRLVAEAFLPNPEQLPEVDHINAVKVDCRAVNLRWCSRQSNTAHRHATGYVTCQTKYTPEICRAVADAIASGVPVMRVAKAHGMSRAHVRRLAARAVSQSENPL